MKKRKSNTGSRLILAVIGVIALVYFGFAIFFIGHFTFGTTINEENVAGKSIAQVEGIFTEQANGYILNISGRDDKVGSVNATDISLRPVFNGEIDNFLSDQNCFAWPLALFKSTAFYTDSVADYDISALKAVVDSLDFFKNERDPEDAKISDYADGGYTVIAEDLGSKLDKDAVYDAVETAVGSLIETLDLDEADCYVKPEIYSDNEELNEKVNNLNKYVITNLTYDFGSEREVLDGNVIKDWLIVDGTSVSLDQAKVKEYVASLAHDHDTFGRKRSFKTTSGRQITVSGGDFGWWMDRPSTISAIVEAVENGTQGEIPLVYFGKGMSYGSDDIGSSYVEIDLDNQHVYVYVSGNMVIESDCVSGKVATGNYTPEGTYSITYKERDATLVGENYSSPVSYWMPFNGNIGMHDATWRSSFGGNIYVTGGSHGCVNLPLSKASKIFDYVFKGEPVIVYGGKKAAPKKELTEEEKQQQLLKQLLEQMQNGTLPAATDPAAAATPATPDAAAFPAQ